MRKLGVVLVVAALLTVTAACGGGKSKSSATATTSTTAPTTTSSTSGLNSTGDTAPAPAGAGGPTGAGGGAPATAAGKTGTTAKPGGSATAATSGTGSSGAASASTTTAHPAAAGHYTYNRTGSATSSAFGTQSLDGAVPLQIDAPNGTDQHTATNPGGGSSTEQTLRFLGDGAYFTDLKQSMSGFTKEFIPNPPVLALPHNAANGRTWHWTTKSTDGATTLDATFTAGRHENVTVGGQPVDCLVLDLILKTSGDINATSTDKVWVSYKYGLVVRQTDVTDGTLGSVTFHMNYDQTLQSVTAQ
jgi:hypothetical protein